MRAIENIYYKINICSVYSLLSIIVDIIVCDAHVYNSKVMHVGLEPSGPTSNKITIELG